MSKHDLVIRGGTLIDGGGAPARSADLAISAGVVTEVGTVTGAGVRELDAAGALVTPGSKTFGFAGVPSRTTSAAGALVPVIRTSSSVV